MLSRRCDKTSEQATMDSGQWTVDEAEVVSPHNWCDWDWLFICFAGLLWLKAKPIPEKSLDAARLVSSLGARRTFRRGPLPVSAWVLTTFWLINITFRFGFPFPTPHKHINTVSCACVPPYGRGGFFWIFSLLLFFFLRLGGLRKQFVRV